MKAAQYDRKYLATQLVESFGPETSHISIGSALGVGRSTVYKWIQRQVRFNAYEELILMSIQELRPKIGAAFVLKTGTIS